MFNLEGATIPGGELAPGNWGEGFVDRRHPHTYVHELVLSATDLLGRTTPSASRSAPARDSRPLALTTRWSARFSVSPSIITCRRSWNGPSRLRRRGRGSCPGRSGCSTATSLSALANGRGSADDSATRGPRVSVLTRSPGSSSRGPHAHVHSPEHRPGAGTDQNKWSLSARWSGTLGAVAGVRSGRMGANL